MTRPRGPRLRIAVLALAALAGAGCRSAPRAGAGDPACRIDAGPGNRPYFVGGVCERADVDAMLAELAVARGERIVEIGRRLVGCGERAVPALEKALTSPDPALRASSAYLLGVVKDRRSIPDLRRVAVEDEDTTVRYEAAGALLELGDPGGFPVLVDGLSDADARRRAKCIDVLAERTQERYGFEPDAAPADREEAIRRWRTWLAVRARDAAPGDEVPPPR